MCACDLSFKFMIIIIIVAIVINVVYNKRGRQYIKDLISHITTGNKSKKSTES